MRWMPNSAAALILMTNALVFSCDDDHHHHDDLDDVTVDITGVAGVGFDARFEDDRHVENLSGVVPFSSDLQDQAGYFQAVVDKKSGGSEQICVKVTSSFDSKQDCTTAPHGQVSVTLTF